MIPEEHKVSSGSTVEGSTGIGALEPSVVDNEDGDQGGLE